VIGVPQFGTSAVLYLLSYSPMAIMWVLFTFTFIFMPNTKVKFLSGLLAGVITGTVYQIVQWIYLSLQIGVSSYNAIYGSFAALPLFIVWLQIAWLIVLFGSEVSFYHQNFDSYRHHDKYSKISFALQKVLTLQIVHLIVKQFVEAHQALTAQQISEKTDMPVSVVLLVTNFASEAGLIVEIKKSGEDEPAYQPALDTSLISVYSVFNAMENCGTKQMPDIQGLEPFVRLAELLDEKVATSAENCLIKDLPN
jgi:membrane protein